ncbi:MAG: flagellar filament capping protein FliD [Phycisphaerales bacterium]|nr:flagellar filament capping protein FliD [Phycisphaerales bacterium]
MGSIPSGYGLISGFDTAMLIERMLAYQSQGRENLAARIGLLQARQSAMLDINAGLLALTTTTTPLQSSALFQAVTASTSHTDVLSATVSSDTPAGIYQFIAAGLATHHQLLSSGFASDVSALGLQGASLEFGGGGLSPDMPLSWLNGGDGVQRGVIEITLAATGESVQVDLSDVATIDEVVDRLGDNGLGINARLENGSIMLESIDGADFTVASVGGVDTAQDLGLTGASNNGLLAGESLAVLGGGLSLAALNDGNGVLVREGVADLRVTTSDGRVFDIDLSQGQIVNMDDQTLLSALNGGSGVFIDADEEDPDLAIHLVSDGGGTTTWDIDLTGCVTVGDVRNRVESATSGLVTLELRSDGRGFEVRPADAADLVSVHGAGTSGTQTAEDLGLLDTTGATGGFVGADVAAIGDGGVPTIQAVIDAINSATDQAGQAADGAIVARIASDGLRLEIEDTTGGSGAFTIQATASNASAVTSLGFADAVASNGTISGRRIIGGPGTVLIHELNGGAGLAGADSITITDRFGNTASASGLAQYETVDDLVQAINAWASDSGLRVNLSRQGSGLVLEDQGGSGSLVVSGELADQLNLAVDAPVVSVSSGNLQHRWISEATALDDLNQGQGIGAGSFRIRDATGSVATITVTSAHQTVQDIIDLINSRGLAVQARINDTGDGLLLDSTVAQGDAIVPMAVEAVSGTTASDLRLVGESDTAIDGRWETMLEVNSQTTLRELVDLINESGANVTAALVDTGDPGQPWRLSLTSTVSGAAGRLEVELDGLETSFEEVVAGRDARIVFGDDLASGVMITSGSNRFEDVIAGLTIDLLQASNEVVTVTVDQDDEAPLAALQAFVEALNGVLDRIDSVTSYDPETGERGVLHGDATASRIKRLLLSMVQNQSASEDMALAGLWEVGLRIGPGGRIELDAETFAEAWETRRADVEALFTAESDSPATGGFGFRLDTLIEGFTTLDGGTMNVANEAWQGRIDLAMGRLENLDARIESRRVRLLAEFAAMEEAIAAMQNQYASLLSIGAGASGFAGMLG